METPGAVPIAVAGRPAPIVVNRYVVARGDERSVVLYWYQSHDRIIASEYAAKFWLIADSIRYRRSDTALVKVVVPVAGDSASRCVRPSSSCRPPTPAGRPVSGLSLLI